MPTLSLTRTEPPHAATLAELRQTPYRYRTVKREMRENALRKLRAGESIFPGLIGYEDTVIPQLVQAILSEHDTLLLGLRGQAKTRLLRASIELLDEWIPVIDHEELEVPDDPLAPTTSIGKRIAGTFGEETPIRWLHREQRFHEKLATPDVTIADLIGEIDLVKHAEGRRLSDEATMHFGLVPRSNRGIFVMNELPDLAPRIQVGLFNVLEERDVQIRGYPIRLDLDLCLMFSANPEDYTNRGRIVTPLKDRIGSVVRTHYPADNREAMRITRENAFIDRRTPSDPAAGEARTGASAWEPTQPPDPPQVSVPDVMHEILEQTVGEARRSAHINQSSGVSVRASIALLECLVSAAELRAARAGEARVVARMSDTAHLDAALRGKIELMLAEESPDGAATEDRLIHALVGEAVKDIVGRHADIHALEPIAEPFADGLRVELDVDATDEQAVATMEHVPKLLEAAKALCDPLELDAGDRGQLACAGELVLEFLYVNNRLSKTVGAGGSSYKR